MLTIRSSTARDSTMVSNIRTSKCLSRLSTGSLLLAALPLVRVVAITDSPSSREVAQPLGRPDDVSRPCGTAPEVVVNWFRLLN